MDFGFEKEGYDIVFVNEYDKEFLKAYKYAHEKMKMKSPQYGYYCGDINDLLRGKLRRDLKRYVEETKKDCLVGFIGGPPCPDFSVAGKNEGISGKNGALTSSYKKIILDQEPDFFLFENVKGLCSTKKHRQEYDKLKKSFERKGYILIDKLVNALDYGVPQERERIILFGIKYTLIDNEKKIANDILKKVFSWGENGKFDKEKRTVCQWPEKEVFKVDSFKEQPKNIIPEITIQYWFERNKVDTHYNASDYFNPRAINRFLTIEEGDVGKKSFKRLHRWRYSPTAAYGNNEVHLHPYKVRRLSVAEALAIQSLPKEYVICKELSKSNMFKTVGNGVPYLMAKGIARAIREFIDTEVHKEIWIDRQGIDLQKERI